MAILIAGQRLLLTPGNTTPPTKVTRIPGVFASGAPLHPVHLLAWTTLKCKIFPTLPNFPRCQQAQAGTSRGWS
ncbi:MAG: hypothetical protein VB135_03755, partial [Burkholderia sp.]